MILPHKCESQDNDIIRKQTNKPPKPNKKTTVVEGNISKFVE